ERRLLDHHRRRLSHRETPSAALLRIAAMAPSVLRARGRRVDEDPARALVLSDLQRQIFADAASSVAMLWMWSSGKSTFCGRCGRTANQRTTDGAIVAGLAAKLRLKPPRNIWAPLNVW